MPCEPPLTWAEGRNMSVWAVASSWIWNLWRLDDLRHNLDFPRISFAVVVLAGWDFAASFAVAVACAAAAAAVAVVTMAVVNSFVDAVVLSFSI